MKPGLYVATVRGVGEVQVWGPNERGDYATLDPVGIGHLKTRHIPSDVTDARPLVVLDPESDEDVRALLNGWLSHDADALTIYGVEAMKQTLRALADPTPAEPMGLGAVVRLADGRRATRADSTAARAFPWRIDREAGDYSWDGLVEYGSALEVLSEGVTP